MIRQLLVFLTRFLSPRTPNSNFLIRAGNKMAHFDRFHGGRWATIAVFRRQEPAALQIMCQIIFRILFKNPFVIHPGSGSLKFQPEKERKDQGTRQTAFCVFIKTA